MRRVPPESADFLIEITTSASTAAHALRENHAKTRHVVQATGPQGVQPADMQTISLNVLNLYSPLMQAMPQALAQPLAGYPGAASHLGPVGFVAPQPGTSPVQTEVSYSPFDLQYGAYAVRNTIRVTVRDVARLGEVVDAITKAGATVLGGFALRASDEAAARRAALEAAGRDARAKAEALAGASGKQLGDPVAIAEEIVATNGTYMALRAAWPFAFGAGAPQNAGELEYYARVSARFAVT